MDYNEQEEKIFQESYGARAVGYKFNPAGLLAVDVMKRNFAEIINDLAQTRTDASDPEVKRMCSVAITEAQTSQMWAVKALTWGS